LLVEMHSFHFDLHARNQRQRRRNYHKKFVLRFIKCATVTCQRGA
jgi:hypothetical protein